MTKEGKSNNISNNDNKESKHKNEPTVKEKTRNRTQKKDKVKPLTKIIIRHLPPTMSEEEFLKQIDPLPEHDFYYYATADWSLGYDATCRAYINLKNYEDVFLFRDRFDGYVFVDSKGNEYPAIVEFAPFQGLAKNKSRKTDPKVNTIEMEQHYKSFLERLEEEREAAAKGGGESKLEFSLDRKREEKITSTPLLQYLANKKEKRREESKRRTEEKRRQREEEKERRQRIQQQQQQQPVTKIMTNQESGSKKESNSKSVNAAGDNRSDQPTAGDECKNSRSKRRAARDQRRREEHEQRKRDRERERVERQKGASVDTSRNLEEVKEKDMPDKEISSVNKEGNLNKSNSGKLEDSSRKEVKKYSERRERDRKRNRKEQEQRQVVKDDKIIASVQETTEVVNTSAKLDEISDSVKNFIRSVATVKEFVPKHKQLEAEQLENPSPDSITKPEEPKVDEVKIVRDDLEELSIATDRKLDVENVEEESKKEENSASLDEKQKQKQRTAEERRIRNKDRPSIAIYQPKPRLRLSEESDNKEVGSKDMRSNPNSDCESLKREDQQRVKKPSRYSERRSERRSKDKRKDEISNENLNTEHKLALKRVKSEEETGDTDQKS